MVGAAEQLAVAQRELVPGQELAAADGASEALQVVDVAAGAHDQVAAAEAARAPGALGAEEPAEPAGEGGRQARPGPGSSPTLPTAREGLQARSARYAQLRNGETKQPPPPVTSTLALALPLI